MPRPQLAIVRPVPVIRRRAADEAFQPPQILSVRAVSNPFMSKPFLPRQQMLGRHVARVQADKDNRELVSRWEKM